MDSIRYGPVSDLASHYVSRTGTVEQMTMLEAILVKEGFMVPDAPAKHLGPNQYRKWQVDAEKGSEVVLLWVEAEGAKPIEWPPQLVLNFPTEECAQN